MQSLKVDPGTFENPLGVSQWVVSGGTFVQSAAQFHSGSFSGLLTVSGSPSQAYARPANVARVPVVPGGYYESPMWCRSPTALSVGAAIDWQKSNGDYISTAAGTSSALVADTWAQRTVSGIAPVDAAWAVYGPTLGGSPANGSQLYLDDADFLGVVITATEQASYPPRVLVSVTGLTLGDDVQVYREIAGERTLMRGGSGTDVTDTSFVRTDAELPFGIPVRYVAVVNSLYEYGTAYTTHSLPGGKVALTDAITGLAAEVVILNIGDRQFSSEATRFKVAGRNVVVSGPWGQAEGSYDLVTEVTVAYESLHDLLAGATEGVVQIRQAGGYDGIDAYLTIDQATVKRFSQDGSDPRRITNVQFAETESWAPELEARGFTLQDIANYYGPSGTLADIDADFTSLLGIAQGDFS